MIDHGRSSAGVDLEGKDGRSRAVDTGAGEEISTGTQRKKWEMGLVGQVLDSLGLIGLAGAGGPGLSLLLAGPGRGPASPGPLCPTWAFSGATHPIPGLPGSSLDWPPERRDS